MSMAAGEYVSVHSQSDTEKADLDRERKELATQDESERAELAHIYVERGLEENLAKQVADQLMAKDALAAHARDELGITETQTARPLQAAAASAASFAVGAAIPLVVTALTPIRLAMYTVGGASLVLLAVLGALGANAGGAPMGRAAIRVTFWGALAMAITSAVGAIFGAVG
jgi:VIT1/CCC1 family predicted Fe2+/Mn2+ transporter